MRGSFAKSRRGDHAGALHGKRAFVVGRELAVKALRREKAYHRVAKELEPLVVLRARMVHPVCGSRERLFEKRRVLELVSEKLRHFKRP